MLPCPRGRIFAAAWIAIAVLSVGSAARAKGTDQQTKRIVVNGAGPVGLLYASALMNELKARGIADAYHIVVVEKRPTKAGPDIRDERLLNLAEVDVELASRAGADPEAFERIRVVEPHHYNPPTRRGVFLPTLQPVQTTSDEGYLTRPAMGFDEAIAAALQYGEDAASQFLLLTGGTLTHRIPLARYVEQLERGIAQLHGDHITIVRDAALERPTPRSAEVEPKAGRPRLADYTLRRDDQAGTLENVCAVVDATGGGAASQAAAFQRYGRDSQLDREAKRLGMERGVTLVVLTLKTPPGEVERLVTYNDNHISDPGAILISRTGACQDAPFGKSSALFLLEPGLTRDEAIRRAKQRLQDVLGEPVEPLPNGQPYVIPLAFGALKHSVAPGEDEPLTTAIGAVLASAAPQRSQGLSNQGRDAVKTADDMAAYLAGEIDEASFRERREQRFELMKRGFFDIFRSWRPHVKRRPPAREEVFPGGGTLHLEAGSFNDVTLDTAVAKWPLRLAAMRARLEGDQLPTSRQMTADVLSRLEAELDAAPFVRVERAVPPWQQAGDGVRAVGAHLAWWSQAFRRRSSAGIEHQPQRPGRLNWAATMPFLKKSVAKLLQQSALFGAKVSGWFQPWMFPLAIGVDKLIDSATLFVGGEILVGGTVGVAALSRKYVDLARHRGLGAARKAAGVELELDRKYRRAIIVLPASRAVLTERVGWVSQRLGETIGQLGVGVKSGPVLAPGVIEQARDVANRVPDALVDDLYSRWGWQPATERLYEGGKRANGPNEESPAIRGTTAPSVDDSRARAFAAAHEATHALSDLMDAAIRLIEQSDNALLGVRHAADADKPHLSRPWLRLRRWGRHTRDLARIAEAVYRVDRVLRRVGSELLQDAADVDVDREGFDEEALARKLLGAFERIEPVLSELPATLKRYVLSVQRAHFVPDLAADQLSAAEDAVAHFRRRVKDEVVEARGRTAVVNRRAEEFVQQHAAGVLSLNEAAWELGINPAELETRIERANAMADHELCVLRQDGRRGLPAAQVPGLGALRDELSERHVLCELGLSPRSLYEAAARAGIAPRRRPDGDYDYRVADIVRLLASQAEVSAAPSDGHPDPHTTHSAPELDDLLSLAAQEVPRFVGEPLFCEDQTAELLDVTLGVLSLRRETLRRSGNSVGREAFNNATIFTADEVRQLNEPAFRLVPHERRLAAWRPRAWRSLALRPLVPRSRRGAVVVRDKSNASVEMR